MDDLSKALDEFYAAQADAAHVEVEGNRPWSKKIKSFAMKVHHTQVGEATEDARKKGVPTEFTSEGCPVFEDRDHRNRYMKAYGHFDRDAGYGDAAPQQSEAPTDTNAALARAQRSRQYIRDQPNVGRR